MDTNVSIRIYDASSLELLDERTARNKVVLLGRDNVRDLLGNLGSSINMISFGAFGTSVMDTDIALGSESYWRLIDRRYALPSAAQFQVRLDASSGNGLTFQEAGLWFGPWYVNSTRAGTYPSSSRPSSSLFARVTFDAIAKSSALILDTTWHITIAPG